ncbi:hypothetical protein GW17_00060863 [Ensete ventricosum]|nr:hypothetical protein GW17_00060863 [Ensete ventricosum]RZS21046.1 hypothetical protein BHM03_00053651 [Ensete ventricosum]
MTAALVQALTIEELAEERNDALAKRKVLPMEVNQTRFLTKDKQFSSERLNRLRAIAAQPRTKNRLQHETIARVTNPPTDVPRS